MAGIQEALWILGSYIVVVVLLDVFLNFLTHGFLHQYLRVKTSRGRLILVKCYDVTDSFYKAGKIDTRRNLIVKDRLGKKHTFSKINSSYVGRELGVNRIEVDLVNGSIIKKDFSASTGFDLTAIDELINRALMLPRLKKDELWEATQKLILIVIVIGVGAIIYLLLTQQPICTCPAVGGNL